MTEPRRFTADSGKTYEIGELLAGPGPEDCQDPRCTRRDGMCVGYHCPKCGNPCSMMGHSGRFNCQEEAA